ncbi:hypothetical protein LZL87_014368 [Fusarium oxysporum]|nr:hypothetical protein LZL87_014368 [Fusarium oxysporum]
MSQLSPIAPLPNRSRPPPSSQADTASQTPSSQSSSTRWTRAQHFFLMDRLLEARRAQKLNSRKKAVIKPVLESFLADFQEEFPEIKWDFRRLESRLAGIRDEYRVWRDLDKCTGRGRDDSQGRITVSDAQERDIKNSHPRIGARVIKNGLWVDEAITIDTYLEIFSNDLPAGRFITEPGDDAAFAAHDALPQLHAERMPSPAEEEQAADTNSLEEEEVIENDFIEVATTPVRPRATVEEDNEIEPLPLSSSRASQTPATSRMKRPSETPIPPNNAIPFPRRKKTKTARASGNDIDDLKALFIASQSTIHKHELTARPVGADDLQAAVRDCTQLFMEERGIDFVV